MRSVKKLFGFCILWVIILTFGANGTALAQVLEMKSSTKTTEENNTEKKTPSSEKVVNNVDAIAGNITKAIEKEQNPSSSQVQITAMDGTTDVVTEPKDPEEESFSLDYKDQKILKEKNKATIVSLEYVGDFSESERAILSNRLKHVLSNYYDLVSGDDKDIHHNLTTQIVKNGNTVQFTMNSKLPNGEFFEEILCENCDLKKQYASINELINRVVRNDSKMSSYDQLRIQDRLASNWQGNDRDLTWHITASSIAVISFWLSLQEAGIANDYISENEQLIDTRRSETNAGRLITLNAQISDNEGQIAVHKQNYQLYSIIALAGVGWESYLLYKDYFSNKEDRNKEESSYNIGFFPGIGEVKIGLKLRF